MTGRVLRVNGPLVEVGGLAGIAMLDLVELGSERLPGEILAIRGDVATVQAYEYTGGLGAGAVARARGEPLSAPLGPHLLGGVFDGLLRPLAGAGRWLTPAGRRAGQGDRRRWWFTPAVAGGATVTA
ncbi:MAG TPA: ATPase, partial [Actinomycetota bacterium]|nr:ATPase [Actinomycetota bacterium]